ncbi:MAG: hypothetical protein NTX79_08725 [Candidatus Micrarchaeota archaeon]|nr:hypothetical protein [Candidatus Micrarchaeota archaeon]
MALPLNASDLLSPLLLVKALLAWLAFFIFIYYRHYWNAAKSRLPVHFFFTKWRAVKHAYFLGYASLGFALGFSLELFGVPLGMSPDAARIASSIFEAASLFCILYVFFSLALEDVPHFQRISDSSAQTVAPPLAPKKAQAMQKPKKRKGKKK